MVFFLLFEVKGTVLSTSCLLECPKSSFNVALFLCYVRLRGKLRIMECGRVVQQCDTLRGIPKLLRLHQYETLSSRGHWRTMPEDSIRIGCFRYCLLLSILTLVPSG